jgi:hypothetical protein
VTAYPESAGRSRKSSPQDLKKVQHFGKCYLFVDAAGVRIIRWAHWDRHVVGYGAPFQMRGRPARLGMTCGDQSREDEGQAERTNYLFHGFANLSFCDLLVAFCGVTGGEEE